MHRYIYSHDAADKIVLSDRLPVMRCAKECGEQKRAFHLARAVPFPADSQKVSNAEDADCSRIPK